MRRGLVMSALVIAAVSCSRPSSNETADDGEPTTTPPTTQQVTTVPTTIEPDPTTPMSTDLPVSSSVPGSSSTTVVTTTVVTTTTSTTLAPIGDPTTGIAVVHVGDGSDFPWTPIGWWDGGGWNEAGFDEEFEPLPVPIPSFSSVSVASVDLAEGPIAGLGYAPVTGFVCVDERVGPYLDIGVEIPETPFYYGYSAVAVSADWDVQPRPVVAAGLDADVYQEIGEAMVSAPPWVEPSNGDVIQVLRTDLDGDGREEVLFGFEYQSDEFGIGNPGDFALVVARYPQADGSVVDEVLYENVVPETFDFPQPGRASIAAVADLNGDGVMEVALRSAGWESSWVTIYEFVDGSLQYAMSGGCGV